MDYLPSGEKTEDNRYFGRRYLRRNAAHYTHSPTTKTQNLLPKSPAIHYCCLSARQFAHQHEPSAQGLCPPLAGCHARRGP